MQKPLTDEQKNALLDVAVKEFANFGYEKTSVSAIAEKADLSVGVIYKYYTDKERFFTATVTHCLSFLDEMFSLTPEDAQTGILEMLDQWIAHVQMEARNRPEYFKLYLQLTAMSKEQVSREVVALIESTSVRVYHAMLRQAKNDGLVRDDVDVSMFSFFFDNMMMMLHFSYCCDYYEERFKVFCGDDIMEKDDYVRQQFIRYLMGAFGVQQGA